MENDWKYGKFTAFRIQICGVVTCIAIAYQRAGTHTPAFLFGNGT